jgi:UDP-2,3-diacylglucosamine hydrolase
MPEFDDALIISDLHLTPANPKTAERFVTFCANEARQVQALFIIGDLFEFWVGDDVHLKHPFYQSVAATIKAVVDAGVKVFFIAGNRDFIIGQQFKQLAQWEVLNDPCLVQIGGKEWLLSHGDVLCTADAPYQLMRRLTRIPFLQFLYNHSPIAWREKMGERLRMRAIEKYRNRESYDPSLSSKGNVTLEACHQVTQVFKCPRLIHGHTHLPNVHQETRAGASWTRWVLSDWDLDHPEMSPRANAFGLNHEGLKTIDLIQTSRLA